MSARNINQISRKPQKTLKRAAAASASRVKKPKLTAFDKKVAAQQKRDAKKAAKKAKKEEFELDEMAWFMRAKAKIDQMTHPKGFEKMVKQFADRMTKPENKKRNPSAKLPPMLQESLMFLLELLFSILISLCKKVFFQKN